MAKIVVAMSGGVDSSLAALLLKNQGHTISGLTFTTGFEKANENNVNRAKKVCKWLGIPHHTVDISKQFKQKVIRYFTDEYQNARTPNPCVICNRHIKFGLLIEESIENGANAIATGHYIRFAKTFYGRLIRRGVDPMKDQSYFLCMIHKEVLDKIYFPLGELTKDKVKELAMEANIPLPPRLEESQDVCFVDKDYRDFLKNEKIQAPSGNFIYKGKVVGQHKGLPFYSLGQRRGLGISVGHRVFVQNMNVKTQELTLGEKPISREFDLLDLNLFVPVLDKTKYNIQIRYQSKIIPGTVRVETDKTHVILDQPHEIITPGQFAAIYEEDKLVAGGLIANPILI